MWTRRADGEYRTSDKGNGDKVVDSPCRDDDYVSWLKIEICYMFASNSSTTNYIERKEHHD